MHDLIAESIRYGHPFVEHSFTYHFTRIDHRHNFSVYNTLLHLSSSQAADSGFHIESLAFVPQFALAVAAIPLLLAKADLPSTMLAQTFAFVTFNKVCTSQVSLRRLCCEDLSVDLKTVLFMVHGIFAILPALLVTTTQAANWDHGIAIMGGGSSPLAAAGLSARIPG